jgi:hypothetical protein
VFGSAIGELFLVTVPLALITVLALAFVPNKPLGRQTTGQRLAGGEASAGDGAASQDDAAENDAAPVGVAVRTAGPGAVSPIVMDTIVPLGESAGETGSTQV